MNPSSQFPPPNRHEPIGQRIFLGADGLLRPMWRAVLFISAAGLGLIGVSKGIRELIPYVPLLHPTAAFHVGSIVQYVLINTALLLVTVLFIRVFDQRSARTLGLWFYAGWLREVGIGICCGGALIAATVGGIVLSGGAFYPSLAGDWVSWTVASAATAIFVLLAAALEEIAFRGYAFQRLVDSIGPLGAVLILSALFGAAHLRNPSATPLSTANTALAGALLGVAYLKTRGLWLPIGLHAAWNFFLGPVFGLPVSGFGQQFQPYLLHAQVRGPDWLTGSSYGPEGSILLSVTCIAAIAWLARTTSVFPSPAMREVLK